jgi:MarR family transcriptional regulator, organic hydroperoxide resistance regulator
VPAVALEIQQRKPFASKAEEAVVTLLRTADVVRRQLGAALEAKRITVQQYNVLRILRGAGEHGLPTLEIASRMIEQAPGITRLIDRLEAKKLVERRRKNDDLRCILCCITPSGRSLLAELDVPMRTAAEEAFHAVNKTELAQLVRTLDRLRESLRKKEEKP